MQHAAHPVTTEGPPGYDGTTSRFKYSDAVEEWCDLTQVEARRRGPAIAACLSGRAELFKERLDRTRLQDPGSGVEYLLSTLGPFFVKDLQSVFLYWFFQMLRCNRGQTDYQRWMVRYEIARQKAVDAWLDATTPRPIIGEAAVTAEVERLRNVALERPRAEAHQAWLGPAAGLQAHLDVLRQCGEPKGERELISSRYQYSLSALMALMADLNESQRETVMNLIFQRDIELTALTLEQSREFLITLFHAPKSSLENPSWAHNSGPRSLIAISHGELDQYEGHWVQDEYTGDEGLLDEHEDLLWAYDEEQCFWMKFPFQGRSLRKSGKSGGQMFKNRNRGRKLPLRRNNLPPRTVG